MAREAGNAFVDLVIRRAEFLIFGGMALSYLFPGTSCVHQLIALGAMGGSYRGRRYEKGLWMPTVLMLLLFAPMIGFTIYGMLESGIPNLQEGINAFSLLMLQFANLGFLSVMLAEELRNQFGRSPAALDEWKCARPTR